jgi:hypothetical protein
VSQQTSSPCGLFSRAEDKLKLSDDVIEEAFPSTATICPRLFHALRSPLSFHLVLRDSLAQVLENPPELEKIVSTVLGTDRANREDSLTRCLNCEWQKEQEQTEAQPDGA